jgi:general secretion pathway protein F
VPGFARPAAPSGTLDAVPAHAPVFRSLAALHRAGVAWPEALASAAGNRPEWREARAALARGASLADALAPVVGPLDLAVLRAGEQTGALDAALDHIAERHDGERRAGGERRAALLYPVLVAHVAAVLLPLPDVVQGRPLDGLAWSAAVLLPLYVVLWVARRRLVRHATGAHPGVRMPHARGLWRNAVEEADARGLAALADCLDAGVPLDQTLALAVDAGLGGRVAWDLHRARPRVAEGVPLASCWQALPVERREELVVAEEAGELPAAARRQAERLRFDVEMRRRKVAAVLPLAVLLLVGGVIALRVIGFYLRMYANLPGL